MSLWAVLITIEVKIENYSVLKYLYFMTWPLVFTGFLWANKFAYVNTNAIINYIQGAVIAGLFIVFGIVAGTNFKFLIGGQL